MRVWLDTDLGTDVDDALALAYVLGHPDLDLVGISTVFGDVGLRVEMTRALLALAEGDRAGEVPVFMGLGVPLTDGCHGVMFGPRPMGASRAVR